MATPTTCPNCDYPIGPGRRSLCPNCRYPLILDDEESTRHAVAGEGLTRPTDRAPTDDTAIAPVITPGHTGPDYGPGSLTCTTCGQRNPAGRVRCERCAASLAMPVAEPEPMQRRSSGRGRTVLIMTGVLLALAAGAGVGWLVLDRDPQPEAPSGSSSASPTASRTTSTASKTGDGLQAVAASRIRASASSQLPSATDQFSIDNVLDDDPLTVWNSNGAQVGPTGPVTLTFRFTKPVDLQRIDIVNGSQKSSESFSANGRPRGLSIRSDSSADTVTLQDEEGSQRLDYDWGPTTTVVIVINSVYRDGATFSDMAISDITFTAAE